MFGKRGGIGDGPAPAQSFAPVQRPVAPQSADRGGDVALATRPVESAPAAPPRRMPEAPPPPRSPAGRERSESYYDTKSQVFSALIDTIDLSQLAKLEADSAREE
ncbi:MAG: CpaF family protein, partial [Rhizobiaceae bacterium]|nr:CpaF family protein [Rhizobiaceae bacterium]